MDMKLKGNIQRGRLHHILVADSAAKRHRIITLQALYYKGVH